MTLFSAHFPHRSLTVLSPKILVVYGGECIEKTGLSIGIIGGIGLGLLLGSEFSGSYITILGAILVIISLVTMGVLSYKGKK